MSVTELGGVPGRLLWPADLWWPGGTDDLACAIGAVHVAPHSAAAVAAGHQVVLLSLTPRGLPRSVILAQPADHAVRVEDQGHPQCGVDYAI